MERTLTSVTLFLIALFLTWLLKLGFKLRLTGAQFVFIAALIMLLLIPVWLLCPAAWHIYGPR